MVKDIYEDTRHPGGSLSDSRRDRLGGLEIGRPSECDATGLS